MTETVRLNLPLLAASQAQKHVTVNEALARLDALVAPTVTRTDIASPPPSVAEGECFVVAAGAAGPWAGHAQEIAIYLNGGWTFARPRAGWRVQTLQPDGFARFDGTAWVSHAVAQTAGGAATQYRVIEFDQAIVAGATVTTSSMIPAQAQVIGVSARVIVALSGTATAWSLGVAGSANRYGSGLGKALNAFAQGLSSAPVTYFTPTPLVLTAEGGAFGTGTVRLAIHVTEIVPPRAV